MVPLKSNRLRVRDGDAARGIVHADGDNGCCGRDSLGDQAARMWEKAMDQLTAIERSPEYGALAPRLATGPLYGAHAPKDCFTSR